MQLTNASARPDEQTTVSPEPTFTAKPVASLAELLQGHAAIQVVDYPDSQNILLVGTQSELQRFEEAARETALSLAARLADLGGLIAAVDHADKGIEPAVIDGAGWLVAELASTIHVLIDSQHTAALGLRTLAAQRPERPPRSKGRS